MYPNNQQSPAPQQQDPYNFIMQSPQKSGPSFTPSSMKARIIIVAAGAVLLITLFVIAASILGSAGKTQQQRYLEIAQKQTEIVRVSALADKKAKSLSARSFAVTTQLAITSDQKKMSDILAKRGLDPKAQAKVLGLGQNSKTDAALDEAEKNNRYDETLRQILETELSNYQKLVSASAGGATAAEKQALETAFNNATLLVAKPEKTPRPQVEGAELLDQEASFFEQNDDEEAQEDDL
mgnify:CR=1 FL=1